MIVWTSRISYHGADRLDVTMLSTDKLGIEFAPPEALLKPLLAKRKTMPNQRLPDEDFRAYAEAYKQVLRERFDRNRAPFEELLARPVVTLVCYCRHSDQCHRTILANEVLAKFRSVTVRGERNAVLPPKGAPLEHGEQGLLFSLDSPPPAPAPDPAHPAEAPAQVTLFEPEPVSLPVPSGAPRPDDDTDPRWDNVMALSLISPWDFIIAQGPKRIENRPWALPADMRGRAFLLHVSKTKPDDFVSLEAFAEERGLTLPPLPTHPPRGGIVGWARAVGQLRPRQAIPPDFGWDTRWWMPEQFGFLLSEAHPLPFVPLSGNRKFFRVPKDLAKALPLPQAFWEPAR